MEDIKLIFEGIESETLPMETLELKMIEKNHGRIETRIYSVCHEVELLTTGNEWSGLKCMGKVISIREIAGKKTEESRYFISSHKLDVKEFAKAVRNHWSIENSLHWVMDIVFRNDESRVRTRHAATNFVTIKHITLNMWKSLPGKISMRVRRKRAGWDNDFLMATLGATIPA